MRSHSKSVHAGGDQRAGAHGKSGAGMRACSQPAAAGKRARNAQKRKVAKPASERRHAAEVVQAHVDPRHAGGKQAEAERVTRNERLARRGAAPLAREPGEGEHGEREEAERREGGNAERAERKSDEGRAQARGDNQG